MRIKFISIILSSLIFVSCNKEYNNIGTDFLRSDTFETNIEYVDVSINQKKIPAFK